MMTFNHFTDLVGMIGVLLVLFAYYFLNIGRLTPLDLIYQLFNLFGSAFILFSLLYNWNLSAVIIEIAWILVSLIGIYRSIRARRALV